jgi:hypothetical protein
VPGKAEVPKSNHLSLSLTDFSLCGGAAVLQRNGANGLEVPSRCFVTGGDAFVSQFVSCHDSALEKTTTN